MAVNLSPIGNGAQYFTTGGLPLNSGFLNTYQAGTLTPQATFTTSLGNVANPVSIPLGVDGRVPAGVWLTAGVAYDFTVTDSLGIQVGPTIRNISGIGDGTVGVFATLAQLAASAGAALIGWIQSGVGAIARTAQDKLRERVSLSDFGAVGNGTADDKIPISNAFTAANGRLVVFPAGTYNIGSAYAAPANSRAYMEVGATLTGTVPTGILFHYEQGRATATAGSKMKIDHLYQYGGFPLENIAGIWTGSVYAFMGLAREFTAADGSVNAPVATQFCYAVNNGSAGDVCAGIDVSYANASTGSKTVFGRNIIAGAYTGLTAIKAVGLEIDVEYSAGTTAAGTGAGLYVNAFTAASVGPVIQSGGISSGTFSNGILLNGIAATGSMLAAQSGLSCAIGVDYSQGVFSTATSVSAGNQRTRFLGNGAAIAGDIYGDTGNNLNINIPVLLINQSSTTEAALNTAFRNSGATSSMLIYNANSITYNAANAAAKLAANSVTSRSINASGTLNASGADYAEYETKRDDCGVVAKGQIIGFDSDGKVTDKWSESVSFGVKTTNPNLVGGDIWHTAAGTIPIEPLFPEPALSKPVAPDSARSMTDDERAAVLAEYEFNLAQWQHDQVGDEPREPMTFIHRFTSDEQLAAKAVFDAEMEAYNAERERLHAQWMSTVYAVYESDLSAFHARLEIERQKVDRIAYCGKVPVNVTGASVGDTIVPIKSGRGIGAASIKAPTFEQYQIAVGKVRRILADGRAEIVVKPI